MVLGARKLNRVFAAARAAAVCHKLGTELPLAWRLDADIPPKLPVCAGDAFLSPGVATPRARAPGGSCSLIELPQRHKSLASPPPRRRRGPKQQGQGKVQTGEKIRAPEQRARSQQLP